MRLFRTTYRRENGQRAKAAGWSLDFTDHLGRRQRLPLGLADKRAAEQVGRYIETLAERTASGLGLDRALSEWLEVCPAKLRDKLAGIGLISGARAAGGKPLAAHLEDYRAVLLARGDTTGYADTTMARIKRSFEGCGFTAWTDIAAARAQCYLAELQRTEQRFSAESYNHYVRAMKGFCRWMMQERRASENPIAYVKLLNSKMDIRHQRRALEPDGIRRLLETTTAGPVRRGMSGPDRAMLYRLAIETGLRAGELRSLTKESFDLTALTVMVKATYSRKRKQDAVLPLRPDTAAVLRGFLAGKLSGVRLFKIPRPPVDLLRPDLEAAGIPYRDASDRVVDFHSLRHTCGSLLAASGVHPKVAQQIMRHSSIDLTMSRYSHVFKGQEADAVAALPDLSQPSQAARQTQATGTDNNPGFHLAKIPAKTPAKVGVNGGTLANAGERKRPKPLKRRMRQKWLWKAKNRVPLGKNAVLFHARPTGLEPATLGSTIQYSNQLSYGPGLRRPETHYRP
jgi:integrase